MSRKLDFHIFRDGRRLLPAAELVARVKAALLQLPENPQLDATLLLLLLAGELECALEDVAAADSALAARLTTMFAEAALAAEAPRHPCNGRALADAAGKILQHIECADVVSVSTPEGFAYYALHPLDYSDLIVRASKLPELAVSGGHEFGHACKPALSWSNGAANAFATANPSRIQGGAFVVGIRSIGTTLSAVVQAQLRRSGIVAERTTVRPTGHPYERTCSFTPQQRNAIARAIGAGAHFIVCDEGPGRSGSSLLSVAEGLEREGVDLNCIVMLCSHAPDIEALCAAEAPRRWLRYRSESAGMTKRLPSGAPEYAGGGAWRRIVVGRDQPLPAVWPQMERLKYLSANHDELLTFEGYGPYGSAVSARNAALSAAGFGAPYLGHEAGFGRHSLPPGRLACRNDLSPPLLTRMAEYCAWRANAFRATRVDSQALEQMTRINLEREFGDSPDDLALRVCRPALCDNRMAPHHWLLTAEGRFLKLDAAIHGDDHFFPGPCDMAWDLAGIIVEWELTSSARDLLLGEYRRASRDNVRPRIQNYELAYATFRMSWSKMAAGSVAGTEEEARLVCDYCCYRRSVELLSGCRSPQSRRPPAAARLREAQEKSAAPTLP